MFLVEDSFGVYSQTLLYYSKFINVASFKIIGYDTYHNTHLW